MITASGTKLFQPLVVGTAFSGTGIAPGTIITSLGTGTGGSGTYNINNPLTATLSGSLNATMAGTLGSSSAPVNLFAFSGGFYFTGAGGTNAAGGTVIARTQTFLGDFFNLIGSSTTTIGAGKLAWGGELGNVSMLWGAFPQTNGAPSATALASLCKKTTDIRSFAAANSLTVHSLYGLNDAGIWGDSSNATITGYIDGVSGTTTTGTLHVVSTPYGSLAPPANQTAIITAPGLAGGPLNAPSISLLSSGAASTYTVTWPSAIAANLASVGSPVTFAVGAWKPAKPLSTNPFNGYIDSVGGTPTLHMTSVTPLATATGTLGNILSSARIDDGTANNPAYTATWVPTTGALTITSAVTGGTVAIGQVITNAGIAGQPTILSGSGTSWTTTTTTGSTLTGIAIKSGTPGTVLTVVGIAPVPTIRYPEVGVGSTLTGNGIASGTHVSAYGTGNGLTGTYTVDTSQFVVAATPMFTSGVLPGGANDVQTDNSSVTGTLGIAQWMYDGGLHITGEPLILTAINTTTTTGFTNWAINQTYVPAFTNDAALTTTQTALVPGQQVFGAGITTPVSIAALGSSAGTYILSNAANGSVGSSGSPVALNATGIQDGAAIAPGRALTIRDPGAAITYPVTSLSCSALSSCTGAGPVAVTGTFDTSLLGGTPTAIQAQISQSVAGPPVPGCSACAWTNLSGYSATLSSGTVFTWNGQALNIPASSGPLYVSVRAANGTAYATMPSFIKMGLVFDWQGDTQLQTVMSNPGLGNTGGTANSFFNGLWGLVWWQSNAFSGLNPGPVISGDISLAFSQFYPGDAFSELQGGVPISEASNVFAQLLTNAFGWTNTVLNTGISQIGIAPQAMGNVVQNQTISVGDGSTKVFCSASIYCGASSTPVGVVSPSGPLIFTDATQTGGAITALIDDGTGTNTPGNILTTSARSMGVLEPGMTLTDMSGHITGSPTLVACTTGCAIVSGSYPAIQKWTISGSAQLVSKRNDAGRPRGDAVPELQCPGHRHGLQFRQQRLRHGIYQAWDVQGHRHDDRTGRLPGHERSLRTTSRLEIAREPA